MSMNEETIKETLRKGEQVTPFVNGQRQRCLVFNVRNLTL